MASAATTRSHGSTGPSDGVPEREGLWALKDVTFSGASGEVIAVVGANGAGKTTLCRVLAGLIRPDAGRITVQGRLSALLSLGTGFDRNLSGRENVYLNGLMLGLSRRDIRTLLPEITEFSGLGAYLDQPLKIYSSGMQARLGFSIGAMVEPDVLILDEALNTGDLEFSTRAATRLHQLMARAKLVIIVTHELAFAEEHCSQGLWLHQGTLRAAGPAQEVLADYRSFMHPSPPAPVLQIPVAPRPTNRPAVVLDRVSVRYRLRSVMPGPRRPSKAVDALTDVSLTVHEGEVVGVIGQNGAGKSTLCRVLRGVLRPDEGRVMVRGERSALTSLTAGLNPQLSGRDNVYLYGLMLGMPLRRLRDVYKEVVAFSELDRFMEEPLKHYSAGMKSRLGFSTAAMVDPDILIVDEVLSAGDVGFQEKAAAKMRELIGRARAVIVVTHDLSFVEVVCTRAVWLRAGRVEFDGTPDAAVLSYQRATAGAAVTGRAAFECVST